eukprot:3572253-Prymnesium_polylepis.1
MCVRARQRRGPRRRAAGQEAGRKVRWANGRHRSGSVCGSALLLGDLVLEEGHRDERSLRRAARVHASKQRGCILYGRARVACCEAFEWRAGLTLPVKSSAPDTSVIIRPNGRPKAPSTIFCRP